MASKRKRDSNIEIMRILTMLGVFVIHYNNGDIGGGMRLVIPWSVNFYVLSIMHSLVICAVNLFILITGYYMCKRDERNLWRPIELIFQLILFHVLAYVILVLVGANSFSFKSLIGNMLPNNSFIILYSVVYIVSPFVNKLLNGLNDKQFKRLLTILILLFSVFPTLLDQFNAFVGQEINGMSTISSYGSQYGYSILNYLLIYIVGSYIRRLNDAGKLHITHKGLKLVSCITILTAWSLLNQKTGFFGHKPSWEYCNPLVIFEASLIFTIFLNMRMNQSNIVNLLAKSSFSMYLLHTSFLRLLNVERYVNGNIFLLIRHIVVSGVVVYVICFFIDLLYQNTIGKMIKAVETALPMPNIW